MFIPIFLSGRLPKYGRPFTYSNAVALFTAIATVGSGGFGHSVAAELPDVVRNALEEQARRLTPLQVTWTEQYSSDDDRSRTLEILNDDGRAVDYWKPVACEVRLQNGMMYSKYGFATKDGGSASVVLREDSFDGDVLYVGTKGGTPMLSLHYMEDEIEKYPSANYLPAAYLSVAGFALPSQLSEWSTPFVESTILRQIAIGAAIEDVQSVTVGNKELLKIDLLTSNPIRTLADSIDLEAVRKEQELTIDPPEVKRMLMERLVNQKKLPKTRIFVYYLDPALQYGLVKWEQKYEDGTLLKQCDMSQFVRVSGGNLYLPRRCSVRYFEFSTIPGRFFNTAVVIQDFTVHRLETKELPTSDFVLKYNTAGSLISDGTLPEAADRSSGHVSYTVPASPADLEAAITAARKEEGMTTESRNPWWRGSFIAVNAVAVLLLIVILAYKRLVSK